MARMRWSSVLIIANLDVVPARRGLDERSTWEGVRLIAQCPERAETLLEPNKYLI